MVTIPTNLSSSFVSTINTYRIGVVSFRLWSHRQSRPVSHKCSALSFSYPHPEQHQSVLWPTYLGQQLSYLPPYSPFPQHCPVPHYILTEASYSFPMRDTQNTCRMSRSSRFTTFVSARLRYYACPTGESKSNYQCKSYSESRQFALTLLPSFCNCDALCIHQQHWLTDLSYDYCYFSPVYSRILLF